MIPSAPATSAAAAFGPSPRSRAQRTAPSAVATTSPLVVDREHQARRTRTLHPAWFEQPQPRATPERMGPRLRVTATDQVVHLALRTAPVDAGVRVAEERIVCCEALVLWLARRASGGDQLHAVQHDLHAEREERLVVERPGRVVRRDGGFALEQDRPGVDAGVGPEDGDAGARLAPDQLPGDGAPAAVARQQRRMEADRRVSRQLQQRLGYDLRDVRQHGQVGARARERLPRRARLERGELMHRDALPLGGRLHRVDLVAAVWRTHHADHLVSRCHEPEQHPLGEGRLPDEENAHGLSPSDARRGIPSCASTRPWPRRDDTNPVRRRRNRAAPWDRRARSPACPAASPPPRAPAPDRAE